MKQRLVLCTTVGSNLGLVKRKETGYAIALPISHFLHYTLYHRLSVSFYSFFKIYVFFCFLKCSCMIPMYLRPFFIYFVANLFPWH